MNFYVTLLLKMKNCFSLQKMDLGIICFFVHLERMLKRLNGDEDDKTVCLCLEVPFHELSWALVDWGDSSFTLQAYLSPFINLRITKMRDVKARQGRGNPMIWVHKCSLPHSKTVTWMIKNIYLDYRDTQSFKTKIRIVMMGSLKIQTKNEDWVQSEKDK